MSCGRHTDALRNPAYGGQGRDEQDCAQVGVELKLGARTTVPVGGAGLGPSWRVASHEVTMELQIIDRQSRFGRRRS